MDQTPRRRKLLVATVGLATVSYAMVALACGKENSPVTGNLPAPPTQEAGPPPVTGNLPAPPDTSDTPIAVAPDAGSSNGTGPSPVSGNLVAPPRRDAGK